MFHHVSYIKLLQFNAVPFIIKGNILILWRDFMSEFNKVTIGRSPYDQELAIKGLKNNLGNGLTELKGTGGSVKLGIYNENNSESITFLGEESLVNTTSQEQDSL